MKIEGKNAVLEFLKSGAKINKIYIQNTLNADAKSEIITLAKTANASVLETEKQKLENMSETGRPGGVIAEIPEYQYASLDEIIESKHKNEDLFLLLLDGIEDPHNLGSILRVAECAGVHGIIIPKHRAAEVTATVAKVSAGALAYVKIAKVTNLNQTIEQLKKQNIFVYAADMDGQNMYKTNLKGPIALVIGGEGKGVSTLTKKVCDGIIKIEMKGKINSLNASVSAGIVIFEVNRQRQG